MSTLFYRNRRLLALAVLGILVAGLSAFATLPRLEDPHLNNRVAIVITRLPGASAGRVEALVTEKIEDELRDVQEIDAMWSMSRPGISLVTVELKGRITRTATAWSKIRDRLAEAEALLPDSASKPELDEDRGASAFTMVAALAWRGRGEVPINLLDRLAEELQDRLQAVAGTEYTERFGEPSEEITVAVDPDELAALGLSARDVAGAVGSADSKVAAGALRGRVGEMLMEVDGELDTVARVARVPLLEADDGRVVRVGDVAEVVRGRREPASEIALVGGREAIAVAARMEPDRRVDRWASEARGVIEGFRDELPGGVDLVLVFDQSVYTEARLDDLGSNLLAGAGSVVLVILVMMGWRSALLVASALPLTLAIVLAALMWLGIPLHQMSITGLIIALGLLIDNAIVVVDEIGDRKSRGVPPAEAVGGAVGHLFVPLLGSTLTTVLAFAPIVLLTGNIGEFVGPMGVSVVLSVLASLLVSLTVVAALTGLFGRGDEGGRGASVAGRTFWRDGLGIGWLAVASRGAYRRFASRPLLGIAVASALPMAGFLRAGELRDQFFPSADRDQFTVQLRLPTATSIEQTRRRVEEASRVIREFGGIASLDWFLGRGAPTVYYNMLATEDDNPGYAQAIVRATSAESVPDLIRHLQRSLDASMPGAQVVVRAFGQGPPVESPIEIRLYGPGLGTLQGLGEEVRRLLAGVPEVLHTRATLDGGTPELRLGADEDEARLAGLSLVDVAAQLQANLEGALGGSILEGTEELPVRVRFDGEFRGELDAIASTNLVSPSADVWIPMGALGDLELSPEFGRIPHREGRRCNTVQGYIAVEALPKEVLARFRERMEAGGFELPPGYRLEFGGDEEEQGEAVGELVGSVGVLAVLMVATLVLSFQSFRMAALIGVVAGLSVGLGLLAIWLSGYPFGFMAIIGTAGLIGVAMNDSIVVLAGLRSDDRAASGDPDGVADVVLRCSRHVLSTTLTTVAGFLPLLLGGGGFWPPLAVVMAGGVIGSSLLALAFVPSAFVLALRLSSATRVGFGSAPSPGRGDGSRRDRPRRTGFGTAVGCRG